MRSAGGGCGSVSGAAVSCDGVCFEALGDLLSEAGEAIGDFFEWLFGSEPEPTPEEEDARRAAETVKDAVDRFEEHAQEVAPERGAEIGSEWEEAAETEPEIIPNTGASSRSGNIKAPTLQGEVAPPMDGAVERSAGDDFGSELADTDPVSLRRGEFYLSETDQEFREQNQNCAWFGTIAPG